MSVCHPSHIHLSLETTDWFVNFCASDPLFWSNYIRLYKPMSDTPQKKKKTGGSQILEALGESL